MTKREAAIVSAYTGFLIGSFSDMQAYADEKLGYVTYTHMFADNTFHEKLRRLSKADFVSIEVNT